MNPAPAKPRPDDDPPLPRLRDDLRLFPGPANSDGSPTWSIHDPLRGTYFRIDWRVMEILSRWQSGRAADVARTVATATTVDATVEDVQSVAHYLRVNELTVCDDPASTAWLAKRARSRRRSLLHRAIHGYLFFRIPLLHPDRFLSATVGWVGPLYSRAWLWTVVVMGLLGLFLVSRQWDSFVGGLGGMVSWEGAGELAVTLAAIKILHEFGHAYTAKRYGCPVPTMGIAFLVLWPVLYTDTTHVYRLTDRKRRLRVAGGGIMVELCIAALAALAWALLPAGSLRDAAQAAAVVSWVGTLAINLNPLMRFDGYYLLADALDLPNLQDRAFALGKWRLRESLFGLGEPPPEAFAPGLRRFLLAYAVGTWIYRFFLFLGIAMLVYQMAFKLLGLFLMAVEILYFIALPIGRELAAWWARRRQVGVNRHAAVTLMGTALFIGVAAWPLSWPVKAPAVLRPAESTALHAPAAALVRSVHVGAGTWVAAGTPLITLTSPELAFEARRTGSRIKALEAAVERESALSDAADRVGVLQEELRAARALALGVTALEAQLTLTAPINGWAVDFADPLRPGQWVQPRQLLGRVVSADQRRVIAFVAADDVTRVAVGAAARFIADDPTSTPVGLRVETLAPANADTLDIPYLSMAHSGPIRTVPTKGGGAAERPTVTVYRTTLVPDGPSARAGPAAARTVAGRVFIDGPPLSLAERAWRAAVSAVIRESNF